MLYEKNIFIKKHKQTDIHFGLCYPNVYKTAMSSLGYNILYNFLNEMENTWCERIIFPNSNSIESNTPARYFDILSFSLQFENDYFKGVMKQKGIQLVEENPHKNTHDDTFSGNDKD